VRTFRFIAAASAAGLLVLAPVPVQAETTTAGGGSAVVIDVAGTAVTPAPEVPGARRGGTLHWLQDGSPEHFDPQQI